MCTGFSPIKAIFFTLVVRKGVATGYKTFFLEIICLQNDQIRNGEFTRLINRLYLPFILGTCLYGKH